MEYAIVLKKGDVYWRDTLGRFTQRSRAVSRGPSYPPKVTGGLISRAAAYDRAFNHTRRASVVGTTKLVLSAIGQEVLDKIGGSAIINTLRAKITSKEDRLEVALPHTTITIRKSDGGDYWVEAPGVVRLVPDSFLTKEFQALARPVGVQVLKFNPYL